MSFAPTDLHWLKSESFYVVVLLCCVALAFKLYSKAFNSRIFGFMFDRRLKTVLRPSGSELGPATPVTTAVTSAENQKVL
jgi:hypothetical protein